MNKHIKKALLGTSAASLVVLGACSEDENPSVDILVGDWEVTIDEGAGRIMGISGPNYQLVFEFDEDGEFSYCYKYTGGGRRIDDAGYKFCGFADWEWVDEQDDILMIDWNGIRSDWDVDLSNLSQNSMAGEVSWEETFNETTYYYAFGFTATKID